MVAGYEERAGLPVADNENIDVIFFGGAHDSEGIMRPLVYIRRTRMDTTSSLTSIIPRRTSLPGPFSSTPMPGTILNHLPDPMIPPE
jgi:hypothetical protein